MEKLELPEGAQVTMTSTHLPRGEFLKLQPQTADWLELPEEVRKSVLELALTQVIQLSDFLTCQYQSLTVLDQIKIEYNQKIYLFTVMEVTPAPAVNIVG